MPTSGPKVCEYYLVVAYFGPFGSPGIACQTQQQPLQHSSLNFRRSHRCQVFRRHQPREVACTQRISQIYPHLDTTSTPSISWSFRDEALWPSHHQFSSSWQRSLSLADVQPSACLSGSFLKKAPGPSNVEFGDSSVAKGTKDPTGNLKRIQWKPKRTNWKPPRISQKTQLEAKRPPQRTNWKPKRTNWKPKDRTRSLKEPTGSQKSQLEVKRTN